MVTYGPPKNHRLETGAQWRAIIAQLLPFELHSELSWLERFTLFGGGVFFLVDNIPRLIEPGFLAGLCPLCGRNRLHLSHGESPCLGEAFFSVIFITKK